MIAVDWGSSSLRAFRLDRDGTVVDVRRSGQGLLKAQGHFAEVLAEVIAGWDDSLVVMAGMVGSRQGWQEVPYVACEAAVPQIAAGMLRLDQDAFPQRQLWLVPGLSTLGADQVPDVMRGEESQLCGLLPMLGPGRHVVLLPGTHSKHVQIIDGRIARFATFMTGELFAVLKQHSLLGRMMEDGPQDASAFAEGVSKAAQDSALLHQLFGVRTRALFDQLAPHQLPGYLSGLLIGHELLSLPAGCTHVHVIAAQSMAENYLAALQQRGIAATLHGEDTVAVGLHLLAQARGLPA